jgi:hypothetical protein
MEDVAYLVNSGLLRPEVAYYTFGYDLLAAWRSDKFWCERYRKAKYWSLLADLVARMEAIKKSFAYNRNLMRL